MQSFFALVKDTAGVSLRRAVLERLWHQLDVDGRGRLRSAETTKQGARVHVACVLLSQCVCGGGGHHQRAQTD
jgi:hypothetical protein